MEGFEHRKESGDLLVEQVGFNAAFVGGFGLDDIPLKVWLVYLVHLVSLVSLVYLVYLVYLVCLVSKSASGDQRISGKHISTSEDQQKTYFP
jgi:hypothetical protein